MQHRLREPCHELFWFRRRCALHSPPSAFAAGACHWPGDAAVYAPHGGGQGCPLSLSLSLSSSSLSFFPRSLSFFFSHPPSLFCFLCLLFCSVFPYTCSPLSFDIPPCTYTSRLARAYPAQNTNPVVVAVCCRMGEAPSTPLTCPHWARQGVRVALFLLFGAQPLRGTTLAPACPMRPASRSRHREPSACSRMSHDLLVSHYASSHLSLL